MSNPWSNQLVSLIVVTAPSGQYAGIFVYSPAPGPGNLIGSWAASAGVDPYGNPYPQGLNVTTGSISGVTFNGTNFVINSTGMFFYSGAPALGNLIASISNVAGTESHGNAFIDGVVAYEVAPSPNVAVTLRLGTVQFWRATGPGGPFTEINGIDLASGTFTNLLIEQDLVIGSNLTVNQWHSIGAATAPPTPTLAYTLWCDTNNQSQLSAVKASGFTGRVPINQSNINGFSNNNSTIGTPITFSYSISANELVAGSTLTIECPFTGTFENSQLNIGYLQDGIFINVVPIGAAFAAAGIGIVGTVRATFKCTATGAAGNVTVSVDGGISNSAANRLPTTTALLQGFRSTQVYDTTVSHTLSIGAQWGAAVAGQAITGQGSLLRREGP